MLQYFSNGIWKPLPHDNFLINVANKAKSLVRPIEAQLHKGEVVKVGHFTFREKQNAPNPAHQKHRPATHQRPQPQGNQ
jgi:hypothetical protein